MEIGATNRGWSKDYQIVKKSKSNTVKEFITQKLNIGIKYRVIKSPKHIGLIKKIHQSISS
jgi:hypothetical protein